MAKILVVATGSVAVIKTKKTIDLLSENHQVKVIASNYIIDNYDQVNELNYIRQESNLNTFPQHIELVKWSDVIVVVPASANTLSKFAAGISDNFVLTTLLASRRPIFFVPAMNTYMYESIVKRGVIDKLQSLNHIFLGPVEGKLREGEIGIGRMIEPEVISEKIDHFLKSVGKKVLLPYGASKIKIDPVRYITNGSTGLMGKILANELRVSGYQVKAVDISQYSNEEFIELAKNYDYDIYISPAAFADFIIDESLTKIKKGAINSLKILKNIDVITELKKHKPNKQYFAFKLDEDIKNAKVKLQKYQLDGIIWNKINSFGQGLISGAIVMKNSTLEFKKASKKEVASKIIEIIGGQ